MAVNPLSNSFVNSTATRLELANEARAVPSSHASPAASPTEMARLQVNQAAQTFAQRAPTADGIYSIGSTSVKVAGPAGIKLYNSWGFWSVVFAIFNQLLFSGCEPMSKEVLTGPKNSAIVDTPQDLGPNKMVCNPFNDSSHLGAQQHFGITGSMTYLNDDQPRYNNVTDYITLGQKVDATLFFSEINVPTRSFDQGFFSTDGDLLTNQKGNKLYEYFSVRFESVMQVPTEAEAGKYQFALLADDGANLLMDLGSGYEVIVNDDGVHSTKMGCATKPVDFNFMSRIPMRVDYYQGPRYHIAVVLLWRPWKENDPSFNPNDPSCGKQGNSLYFNYNTIPSTPQKAYNDLLARGWRTVPSQAFTLPENVRNNPCSSASVPALTTVITQASPNSNVTNQTAMTFNFSSNSAKATFSCSIDGSVYIDCISPITYSGLSAGAHSFNVRAIDQGQSDQVGATHAWSIDLTPPVLANIRVTVSRTTAQITWQTDKPTTSKLFWGLDTATNLMIEDKNLTKDHTINITNLDPDTVYSFMVSASDEAGNLANSQRLTWNTDP